MKQPRCYLLEIPVELRLRIYEELLPQTEVLTLSVEDDDEGSDAPLTLYTNGYRCQCFLTCKCSRRYTSILRTCRQIQAEAEPLLYSPVVLRLQPTGFASNKEKPFDVRKLRLFKRLHDLRIEYDNLYEWKIVTHSAFLRRHLGPALSVDRIHIDLCVKHNPDATDMSIDNAIRWLEAVGKAGTTIVHVFAYDSGSQGRWKLLSREMGRDGEWKDYDALIRLGWKVSRQHAPDDNDAQLVRAFATVKDCVLKMATDSGDVQPAGAADGA
ncbi:hypothetical protein LTR08_003061 [Meristemomyces frigidus]|nr:hypothetical protein LTR08_003061 [Meristemomyces frigidus]